MVTTKEYKMITSKDEPDLLDKYIKIRKTLTALEIKRREFEKRIEKQYDFSTGPIYREDSRVKAYTKEKWDYPEHVVAESKEIRKDSNKHVKALQLKSQASGTAKSVSETQIVWEMGKR